MPQGENKCAACGQFAGRGHSCPATLNPNGQGTTYVAVSTGERHSLREDITERVSRAMSHLRPHPQAPKGLPKQPPTLKRDTPEWEQFEDRFLDGTHMTETKAGMMATILHEGQTDQSGVAYIDHPRAVNQLVQTLPEYASLTPEERTTVRIAALLHDTLEDTALNEDDLRRAGCSDEEIRAINAVTSGKGEPKPAYYARVKAAGPAAVVLKAGDLAHNNLPERRETLAGSPSNPVKDGEEDRYTKLGKKYWIAYTELGLDVPDHLREFAPDGQ